MMKVNLGCGRFPKQGYVNVDVDTSCNPDIVHDMDVYPYPFKTHSVVLLEADHVLEHLKDPFAFMREARRIITPGGRMIVRVPHFSRGFTHAGHIRGFDVSFPWYFRPDYVGGYSGTPWVLERARLCWMGQYALKRQLLPTPVFWLMRCLSAILNVFANASPFVCSRIWCFWVGGFDELEFVFRAAVESEQDLRPDERDA